MDPDAELLVDLVGIPSPTGQTAKAAEFLAHAMRQRGFREAFVDEVGNAVGVAGQGTREVLLVGHLDTVPGELPVRVHQGEVWGRGAVDAKGPLGAFVGAAARLAQHPDLRLVVVGCMDEEGPSVGARALLRHHRPEALVIGEPSGTDGVTLGYRGIARFHYTLEDDLVHGAGEHPGVPDRAFAFWQELQGWLAPRQGPSAFTSPTARLGSFRTQALPGGRVRADLAGAVRLPPGFPTGELLEAMRGAAGPATLSVDEVEPPWESPRDSALARAFVAAVREQGRRPRLVRKTGTSDMNVLAPVWKVPAVAYGPGDSRLDHTPHERVRLADYHASIAVLTSALARLGAQAPAR